MMAVLRPLGRAIGDLPMACQSWRTVGRSSPKSCKREGKENQDATSRQTLLEYRNSKRMCLAVSGWHQGFFLDQNFRNIAENRNSRYPPRKASTIRNNLVQFEFFLQKRSNKLCMTHITDDLVWCGGNVLSHFTIGLGFDSSSSHYYFWNSFEVEFVKKYAKTASEHFWSSIPWCVESVRSGGASHAWRDDLRFTICFRWQA
jgi:hypothetical protein